MNFQKFSNHLEETQIRYFAAIFDTGVKASSDNISAQPKIDYYILALGLLLLFLIRKSWKSSTNKYIIKFWLESS